MASGRIAAHFDHSSLNVEVLDAAIAFYCAAFGYELRFREDGLTDEIQCMTGVSGLRCDLAQLHHPGGGPTLELIRFQGQPPAGGSLPAAAVHARQGHIAFAVESLDTALSDAEKLGARLIGDIAEYPECRSCYCLEPGGSVFEMSEFFE